MMKIVSSTSASQFAFPESSRERWVGVVPYLKKKSEKFPEIFPGPEKNVKKFNWSANMFTRAWAVVKCYHPVVDI